MARHAGIRLTLVGMAAIGWASAGRAQTTEGVPAPQPDAATVRTNAASPARATAPVVLFLMPQLEPEVQSQLRDALLAQFALIEATLDFEPAAGLSGSLSQRMSQAQALSAERNAIAAFWVEEQPDGRWLVHMMDNEQERIIVRAVDAQGDRRGSAIEAVAVIARESTRALIEGVPESAAPTSQAPTAPPPAPPPPAPPSVEPPPAPPRLLRVWAGYSGNGFAPKIGWQHAAAIGMSFMGLAPAYGGLGYLFTPTVKVDSPAFTVERVPLMAYLGYRYLQDQIALDGQLGFSLEWLIRDASPTPPIPGVSVTPAGQQSTHRLAELSPRLRIELRLRPDFGLYAGGGADILINQIQYVLQKSPTPPMDEAKLTPNRVRPMAEVGLAFYP